MGGNVKRISHCSHWGAYTILVQDDRVIGIEPFSEDPAPSKVIQSVTGWADPSKRILKPLVRRGWLKDREKSDGSQRGRDQYVEVSWDEVLGLVASEIDRVRHTHGNKSIFAGSYGWTSCGRFHHAPTQMKRMLNMVGGFTGHVDTYSIAAGPVILREVLGSDAACTGGATTLDNVAENSETVVVFGALSPRTAQSEAGGIARHMVAERLRRLSERGARMVLVSPVRDDLPEWVDAEWLPIRPNTDTALMLALAQEIVAEGRHDREFLDTRCSGATEFLDYLSGASDGVKKDAEWASRITGIPAETIKSLAQRLPASRTMLSVSWSLQRADHGEQPFWAALALASIIGQIGLPGGGVAYGYGSLGGVGEPMSLTNAPAITAGAKAIPNFIPVARISDLLLNPGKPFEYQGNTYEYPDTRMVFWAGGNPYHHHQDINRLRRAWARPETIILQDPVWTATVARADIVLPATTSIERNDISASLRSDCLVAMQKAIEPLGQSRTDYDIFCGISERLGIGAEFSQGRSEMEWLRFLYEDTRQDAATRLDFELPEFDEFWSRGWAQLPTQKDYVLYKDFREDPEKAPLPTESGRIVLTSERLRQLDYDDCPAHPTWIEPSEWLNGKKNDSEKPVFHLVSRQPPGRLHAQLDYEAESTKTKAQNREKCILNPKDAQRLDIREGETVRIWNGRGQCLAVAALDESVHETSSSCRPEAGTRRSMIPMMRLSSPAIRTC
jgi:biotin/methionine sulfoxide reductase